MTKDNKTLIYYTVELFIIVVIVFISIQTIQYLNYNIDNLDIGNSTQEQMDAFFSGCDLIYGLNNWSIYGADWIDFVPYSNHPTYLQNTHRYTCFKNGTMP